MEHCKEVRCSSPLIQPTSQDLFRCPQSPRQHSTARVVSPEHCQRVSDWIAPVTPPLSAVLSLNECVPPQL